MEYKFILMIGLYELFKISDWLYSLKLFIFCFKIYFSEQTTALNDLALIWKCYDIEVQVVLNSEVQSKITFFKNNQRDYREKKY